jgi:DNA-binding XRE family transcriptional regulator
MKTLGTRLKQARLSAGLSQSELARRLGVSHATINKWERGTTSPSRDNLLSVAEGLNASVMWLLYGKDNLINTIDVGTVPPLRAPGAPIPMLSVDDAAHKNIVNSQSVAFSPVPLSGENVAISLPDDSNAPDHPRGTIWILSYTIQPTPGDYVLGRHGNDLTPILGVYSVVTTQAGRVQLITPRNSLWSSARDDIEAFEIIAVMVSSTRLYRA